MSVKHKHTHTHKAQLRLTAQSEYLRFFWHSFFASFEFYFCTSRRRLIVLQFAFIVYCCIMHWARHLLLLLPIVANVRAAEPKSRESRAELSWGVAIALSGAVRQLSNESQFDRHCHWPLAGLPLWPRGLSRRRLSRSLFLWAAAMAAAAAGGSGASRRAQAALSAGPNLTRKLP